MQERHLFEYAVIRIVPRVEREEFLNVGVMLYCKKPAFLQMRYTVDQHRLLALFGEVDLDIIQKNLTALEEICHGTQSASPIARLDIAERFRWLTAKRSTVIQCSAVHPGRCTDPETALEKMFRQMVL
jgi:Protein of unknown function (DUF3037)